MKKFYKNVTKRSIFFSLLVLSFPLISLLPSAEPFVIGGEIFFHWLSFGAILTIVLQNMLTKRNTLKIPLSKEFKLTFIFCLYITLHSIIQQIPMQMTTPFAICLTIFFLIQNKKTEIFKLYLAKYISFSTIFYLLVFHLTESKITHLELFGHKHFFLSWMLLIFPVILWNILKTTKKMKLLNILIASLIFCTLIFSSNSTIISLLTIIILILFLNYIWFNLTNIKLVIITFLTLSIFILFYKDNLMSSLQERLFIWKLCLLHANHIPIFGVGIHHFESFYQSILNGYLINTPILFEAGKTEWYEWAHNELIHCMIEYGIPGLISVILIFFYTFKNIINLYNTKNDNAIYYMGLSGLIIYSLFSFPFRMPSVSMLALILFSQLLLEKKEDNYLIIRFSFSSRDNFIISEIFIIILFLFSIIIFKESYAYYSFSKGISQTQESSLNLKLLRKSYLYNPHSKLYTFALGKAYLDKTYPEIAEYYFQQSVNIVPATPQLFALALTKDLLNKQEQAKDLYEKIRRISPRFSLATHNLKTLNTRISKNNFSKNTNKTDYKL